MGRKCYAAGLENCKGKLTAEHYISNTLLQWMKKDGKIEVRGLPIPGRTGFHEMSPKSMTARFLCERHNHELSPVDVEGSKWVSEIHDGLEAIRTKTLLIDHLVQLDGLMVERWLLKIACGIIASGNAMISESRVDKTAPPPSLLKALFGQREIGPDCGLYLRQPGKLDDDREIVLSLESVYHQQSKSRHHLAALEIYHSNIYCFLALDPRYSSSQIDLNQDVMYRPGFLEMQHAGFDKKVRIELKWPTPRKSGATATLADRKKGGE